MFAVIVDIQIVIHYMFVVIVKTVDCMCCLFERRVVNMRCAPFAIIVQQSGERTEADMDLTMT